MRSRFAIGIAVTLPIAFLGLFFVYPVVGLSARGLAPHDHLDWGPLWRMWLSDSTRRIVWFTVWSAGLATVISVVVALPVAYALYRLRFPGQQMLRGIVSVPFVLPTVVVGIAFNQLFSNEGWLGALHLEGTAASIVVALVYFNVGLVVRTVGRYWADLDPRLAQAARGLGAGPIRVWFTVTVRSLAPAIGAAASVVFLFCATAFGVVLMLGGLRYSNLETEIYYLTTEQLDLPAATALSLLQLVAVAGLLIVIGRIRPGQLRRVATDSTQRIRRRDVMPILSAFTLGVMVVIPLLGLVTAAFRRDGAWSLDHFRALASTGETTGGASTLLISPLDALANSLLIAALATAISLGLAVLIAFAISRPRMEQPGLIRVACRTLDGAFMLPLGVSAVTVGLGYLVTLNRAPLDLRGSFWLIPLAQALVALPLVLRTVLPVWRSLDDRQRQVASSLGAAPWQVLWSVDLWAIRRAILTASGFAIAVSMGEFGATSFLARDDSPTLPVVIYKLLSRPGPNNAGMALAAASLLAVCSVGLMWACEAWGERDRSLR